MIPIHITYEITGQVQNRINQWLEKNGPSYAWLIWGASFSCLVVPMLVFGKSLSNITLSGLLGSSLATFFILKLGIRYANHKRFSLHYQPELHLETRTLHLLDQELSITSSLKKPARRRYKEIKKIKVEDDIIIIIGKQWWFELIPRDAVTEGSCSLLLYELCDRARIKL